MSFVDRVLFMSFDQLSSAVEDFLPKSGRFLTSVYFLDITGLPALPSGYLKPVTPAATWQILPSTEFPLILLSGTHPRRAS
jgi:hypothetical protein